MQQQSVPWESWPRKPIFDFFSPMSHPFYAVTFTCLLYTSPSPRD